MCCDASSPEEKSEEPAKQNEDRTGHSGGCCGLGVGEEKLEIESTS